MYMLDSSQPPTAEQLAAAARDGCCAWGGYLSSPGHPEGWPASAFAAVRAAGMTPVFIDLGSQAGRIGEIAAAAGARPGDLVVTDIEAGGATAQAAGAWRASVAADGFRPGIYGTDATVDAVGHLFAVQWRARYGTEPAAVPAGELVQWRPTHDEFGISVDRTAVGTEVFDMGMTTDERLDVARALTRLTYASVGARVPESQDAEDGWAAKGRDGSFDWMVRDLLTSPEFSTDMAKESEELHEPANPSPASP